MDGNANENLSAFLTHQEVMRLNRVMAAMKPYATGEKDMETAAQYAHILALVAKSLPREEQFLFTLISAESKPGREIFARLAELTGKLKALGIVPADFSLPA